MHKCFTWTQDYLQQSLFSPRYVCARQSNWKNKLTKKKTKPKSAKAVQKGFLIKHHSRALSLNAQGYGVCFPWEICLPPPRPPPPSSLWHQESSFPAGAARPCLCWPTDSPSAAPCAAFTGKAPKQGTKVDLKERKIATVGGWTLN